MQQPRIQLTIRGLDGATKQALTKKAAGLGMSLNSYIVTVLRRGAGTDSAQARYEALPDFMAGHEMTAADRATFDNALAWSDAASRSKQQAEDDARF